MREIKCRAWDKEANIMIYSDHRTRKLYDVYYSFEMNNKGKLECRWDGEWNESQTPDGGVLDNIMQYTGLLDKNGKEIYEGDIIRTHFSFSHEVTQEPFIIQWNKDKAMFEGVKQNPEQDEYLRSFSFFPEQRFIYEIIGNIHENPELLEVQE